MRDNTELRKALTSVTGSALVPYDLDPILHEELLQLQPLTQLLSILPAEGKTHEFSVRSTHPQAWFEGEATPANQASSTYTRKSVVLKIMRQWGGVTGYSRAVSEKFIDNFVAELEGSIEGMSNTIEYSALFGCANDVGFTGDAYQFTGLLPYLFAYAQTNVVDAGGDKVTLDDLDGVLAKVNGYRGVQRDPKFYVMSMRMKQVIDGLQTRVQLPLRSAELYDGKLVMGSYAGIPIFESDYMAPQSTTTSPDVASVTPITGGALADSTTFYYKISSVTMYGEQVPGTAGSGTTATPKLANTVSWTADSNALLYMIWRGTAAGTLYLLDIIPAKTYDAAGTVNGSVASYTDLGALTPKTSVKPLASGEQQIICVNSNAQRGAAFVGLVDDMGQRINNMSSFVELARTKDTYDYMLKSYLALRLVHPNLISVIRHAKLA